jgi:hypothetical protein
LVKIKRCFVRMKGCLRKMKSNSVKSLQTKNLRIFAFTNAKH